MNVDPDTLDRVREWIVSQQPLMSAALPSYEPGREDAIVSATLAAIAVTLTTWADVERERQERTMGAEDSR
jgi:hypothetical protein